MSDEQEQSDGEPTRPVVGWAPPSDGRVRPAGPPPSATWPPQGRHAAAHPGPHPDPYAGPYAGPPGPQWGPPPTRPPAGPPRGQEPSDRTRLPGWLLPVVAGLALLLGLVGGALGAVAVDRLSADAELGQVEGGLDDVETREQAPLPADNGSVAAVARQLLPSTVQIIAEYDGESAGATGSGFVLDRQGHIVTNNHVVASAAEEDGPIEVVDHRGNTFKATVVGRSPVYDLAVLQLSGASSLTPAALGASRGLNVGEPVVAFGAPLGLSQTVTSGIVSALDRPVTAGDSDDQASYINAVQTDAAINPGNSGGPLVNLAGEVVGVNSAIATTGGGLGSKGGNIGVGFAIPIEQVRTTADQILRTGEARYPVIGAQVRTGGVTELDGARITEVMDGTPAQAAGLQKDDLIVEVEGERVTDGIALIVAIRTHLPGETIEFTVERGDQEQRVEVTLDGKVG